MKGSVQWRAVSDKVSPQANLKPTARDPKSEALPTRPGRRFITSAKQWLNHSHACYCSTVVYIFWCVNIAYSFRIRPCWHYMPKHHLKDITYFSSATAFSVVPASNPGEGNTQVAPWLGVCKEANTMPKQWYRGTGQHIIDDCEQKKTKKSFSARLI